MHNTILPSDGSAQLTKRREAMIPPIPFTTPCTLPLLPTLHPSCSFQVCRTLSSPSPPPPSPPPAPPSTRGCASTRPTCAPCSQSGSCRSSFRRRSRRTRPAPSSPESPASCCPGARISTPRDTAPNAIPRRRSRRPDGMPGKSRSSRRRATRGARCSGSAAACNCSTSRSAARSCRTSACSAQARSATPWSRRARIASTA